MSQLQATTSTNDSIKAMLKGFQSLQTMQGAASIGKSVQAKGLEMSHDEGKPSNFSLDVKQPLKDVRVVISDKNGPVKELSMGDLPVGSKGVVWDGVDNSGVTRDYGQYQITVYGTDTKDKIQSIDSIVPSKVNSVSINPDGTLTLQLATGEKVAMSDVREISG